MVGKVGGGSPICGLGKQRERQHPRCRTVLASEPRSDLEAEWTLDTREQGSNYPSIGWETIVHFLMNVMMYSELFLKRGKARGLERRLNR